MASTEVTGPDPDPAVISVSTTDVATSRPLDSMGSPSPGDERQTSVGAANIPPAGAVDSETGETQLWQDRFAFGNFAAQFLVGFVLIALCIFFVYRAADPVYHYYRPLAILSGVGTTCYWLWLVFNIFRSRFRHRYRLTSRRLFVDSGVFRRQEDMMELEDLKEVTVQQESMFDHLFKVGHVVVSSTVKGSPTLILVGVKYPHKVSDLIYQHARKEEAKS